MTDETIENEEQIEDQLQQQADGEAPEAPLPGPDADDELVTGVEPDEAPKEDWGVWYLKDDGPKVTQTIWKAMQEVYELGVDVSVTLSRPDGDGGVLTMKFDHQLPYG